MQAEQIEEELRTKISNYCYFPERFRDNHDGTVLDHKTKLIWLKATNFFGLKTWAEALEIVAALESGEAGLFDGSQSGDWRLPTKGELSTLIESFKANPKRHWTLSTMSSDESKIWSVNTGYGVVNIENREGFCYVWPVRGGSYEQWG